LGFESSVRAFRTLRALRAACFVLHVRTACVLAYCVQLVRCSHPFPLLSIAGLIPLAVMQAAELRSVLGQAGHLPLPDREVQVAHRLPHQFGVCGFFLF
jgi:hypothetical protein